MPRKTGHPAIKNITFVPSQTSEVLTARTPGPFLVLLKIGTEGAGRYETVQTIPEASEACRRFIEAHGIGASQWSGGKIRRPSAVDPIAYVSYNGRVWSEGFTRDSRPLYDPIKPAATEDLPFSAWELETMAAALRQRAELPAWSVADRDRMRRLSDRLQKANPTHAEPR